MGSDHPPSNPGAAGTPPLAGITVVDLTRMLPGAVLARQLIDLGARWIKVEDPSGGDLMRHLEPTVDGTGAGFAALFRGAESVTADLRSDGGRALVRRLAARADVVVESFRPGTLQRWGLTLDQLRSNNPRLITCSINAYGTDGPGSTAVAHDLNLMAVTGALACVGPGVPQLQLADITCGLLASSAIVAAVVDRLRSGQGRHLEQPLVTGSLALLAWSWADAVAGSHGITTTVLAGRCPAYRRYRCQDGLELVIAAIEPKFWQEIVHRLGCDHLLPVALDCGQAGNAAASELEELFATAPRQHWLDRLDIDRLPVSPVHTLESARTEPLLAPFIQRESLGGGETTRDGLGSLLPSLATAPAPRAPKLGEHTAAILAELDEI